MILLFNLHIQRFYYFRLNKTDFIILYFEIQLLDKNLMKNNKKKKRNSLETS